VIELYNRTWADLDGTITADGVDIVGYYQKDASGIFFYTPSLELTAFIRRDGVGPVTCHRLSDGRVRYMFSTTEQTEFLLGIPDSYIAEIDGAKTLAAELFKSDSHRAPA